MWCGVVVDPGVFALGLIVLLAFLVEATAGFGATVVTVTLAALWLPITEILAIFIPVNLLLSVWLAWRYRASIDLPLLIRRILPLMILGTGLGVGLRGRLDASLGLFFFGTFIVVLSAVELRRGPSETAPLSPGIAGLGVGAAGVVHGLFACGGPMLVWVVGREVKDKTRFRATLSAVWLLLGLGLLTELWVGGAVGELSLIRSLFLLPSLMLGLHLGEKLHHAVAPSAFRRGVYQLLLVMGLVLLGRSTGILALI